jgi:16S rRNA (guanine966-N2)-methyltransferase
MAAPGRRALPALARSGPARASRPVAARAQAHEVRIIGGIWRRSLLPVPDLPGLRPTPDRVRETLFNWLGQDLSGWRCLDAFAGSGALGFEAASRGAIEVVLIEADARQVDRLRGSQDRLGATALRIERADALAWMARGRGGPFDLVLLDPPFGLGLAKRALRAALPLTAPRGLIYLEAEARLEQTELDAQGLVLHRHLKAGASHAHLLVRREPVEAPSDSAAD